MLRVSGSRAPVGPGPGRFPLFLGGKNRDWDSAAGAGKEITMVDNFFPRRHVIFMLVFCLLHIPALSAIAAEAYDILGVWNNEEKDAMIEMFKCGEKYYGKIVWLKEPDYPRGSKDGVPGTPRLDHNNPNLELRKTPIIGLQIVHDFTYAGGHVWSGGKVYDPKKGKTYSGKMTLVSPTQLKLRGFIGISLIGRTVIWTR